MKWNNPELKLDERAKTQLSMIIMNIQLKNINNSMMKQMNQKKWIKNRKIKLQLICKPNGKKKDLRNSKIMKREGYIVGDYQQLTIVVFSIKI